MGCSAREERIVYISSYLYIDFYLQVYDLQSEINGFSHGLKTCHRHVSLTAFQIPFAIKRAPHWGALFMAEKEGFEPSIPFWGIHDFQSCALGQLRDFSKFCNQLAYNTTSISVCQAPILEIQGKICPVFPRFVQTGCDKAEHKNRFAPTGSCGSPALRFYRHALPKSHLLPGWWKGDAPQ